MMNRQHIKKKINKLGGKRIFWDPLYEDWTYKNLIIIIGENGSGWRASHKDYQTFHMNYFFNQTRIALL